MTTKAHPIIRQIVDRDCHVSASNRAVIRHVVSRLKNKYATFRAMALEHRRSLMRDCIAVHGENRNLYRAVMTGRVYQMEG